MIIRFHDMDFYIDKDRCVNVFYMKDIDDVDLVIQDLFKYHLDSNDYIIEDIDGHDVNIAKARVKMSEDALTMLKLASE